MPLPLDIALGIGPPAPPSPYAGAARWFDPFAGFNLAMPPVPARAFAAELEAARTATGSLAIGLDIAPELGLASPATTPAMLARYLRLRPDRPLTQRWAASTAIVQVLSGSGTLVGLGSETLAWRAGDVVIAPAGGDLVFCADDDALLVAITDEPLLALLGVAAPGARFAAAHYQAAEIRRHLLDVYRHPRAAELPGKGIFLGNAALGHLASPCLTAVVNSVLPGESQPPHRHNAAAITVVVDAESCWSQVDDQRIEWLPQAVFVTPPSCRHGHRNDGARAAFVLTVQDSGLHYHLRTMGFSPG